MAPDTPPPSPERLHRAKRAARDRLLTVDGVQGVGTGEGTVRVYVRDLTVRANVPDTIYDVPCEVVLVGDVTALG